MTKAERKYIERKMQSYYDDARIEDENCETFWKMGDHDAWDVAYTQYRLSLCKAELLDNLLQDLETL